MIVPQRRVATAIATPGSSRMTGPTRKFWSNAAVPFPQPRRCAVATNIPTVGAIASGSSMESSLSAGSVRLAPRIRPSITKCVRWMLCGDISRPGFVQGRAMRTCPSRTVQLFMLAVLRAARRRRLNYPKGWTVRPIISSLIAAGERASLANSTPVRACSVIWAGTRRIQL